VSNVSCVFRKANKYSGILAAFLLLSSFFIKKLVLFT
jgi:hypothetical protein